MITLNQAKSSFGKDLWKELKTLKLKPKDIIFVSMYINNGFNGQRAFLDARLGKKKSTPESLCVMASRKLGQVNIQQAIRIIIEDWLAEQKLSFDKKIIQTLSKRAFYDPSTFYDMDGNPKIRSLSEIPEEDRCVIDGIEKKFFGKEADVSVIVLKLADRNMALRELSKYIGLIKDTVEVDHRMSKETEEKLNLIFRGKKPEEEKKE